MASEVFRRVGRGGAGNWYSKKDVEDADKAALEDIEAQGQQTSISPAPSAPTAHTHGGRGGAGNFVDPSTASQALQQEKEETKLTKEAVERNVSKPKTGLSGRGGMGNWSNADAAAQAAAVEEDERKRRELLEAKVRQDVESDLLPPPPAYHLQGREQDALSKGR